LGVERVDDDIHESAWMMMYLPTSATKGIFSTSHFAPHSAEMSSKTNSTLKNCFFAIINLYYTCERFAFIINS
jgi:hypothetical protein